MVTFFLLIFFLHQILFFRLSFVSSLEQTHNLKLLNTPLDVSINLFGYCDDTPWLFSASAYSLHCVTKHCIYCTESETVSQRKKKNETQSLKDWTYLGPYFDSLPLPNESSTNSAYTDPWRSASSWGASRFWAYLSSCFLWPPHYNRFLWLTHSFYCKHSVFQENKKCLVISFFLLFPFACPLFSPTFIQSHKVALFKLMIALVICLTSSDWMNCFLLPNLLHTTWIHLCSYAHVYMHPHLHPLWHAAKVSAIPAPLAKVAVNHLALGDCPLRLNLLYKTKFIASPEAPHWENVEGAKNLCLCLHGFWPVWGPHNKTALCNIGTWSGVS